MKWSFLGLGVKTSYDLYSEPVVAYVSSCVLGFSPQSNRTFRLGILSNTLSPILPKFFLLFFSRKQDGTSNNGIISFSLH